MVLSYEIMIWDPNDIGAREDSFQSASWDPPVNAMDDVVDADYLTLTLAGALSECIIPAGQTSVTVLHEHGSTPAQIHLTPRDFLNGRKYWVSDLTSTTFKANIDNQDGVDHAFWWGSPLDGITGGGAGGPGYKQKNNISVDPSAYPYIVIGIEGDSGSEYYIQIYDGSWQTAVAITPAPLTYRYVTHYIGDLGFSTITAIRLGVSPVPGARVQYDFVEFHSRVPHFPEDLVGVKVNQNEISADLFDLEAIYPKYVGSDVALLMNFEEDVGEKVFDESMNGHVGTFSEHGILELYDDDETVLTAEKWTAGSYDVTLVKETTIVKSGQSSALAQISAGSYAIVSLRLQYGATQDWSSYDFISLYFYGRNSGDTLTLHLSDTGAGNGYWNITENWSGWKRITLILSNPDSGSVDLSIIDYWEIYWTADGEDRYLDRVWLVQGPAFAEAEYGYGLQFGLVLGQRVDVPYSSILDFTNTSDFTIIASINVLANPTSGNTFGVIGKQNKYGIDVNFTPTPMIRAGVRDAGGMKVITHAQTVVDVGRIHIAYTFKAGDMMYLYVDGESVDSRVTTDVADFAANLVLSSRAILGGTVGDACSILDEVLFFNRALSSTEIKRHYNSGPPTRTYVKGRYIRIALGGDS